MHHIVISWIANHVICLATGSNMGIVYASHATLQNMSSFILLPRLLSLGLTRLRALSLQHGRGNLFDPRHRFPTRNQFDDVRK